MSAQFRKWTDPILNNIAVAHLLGLCPLLAVSSKLIYALVLGLCTWVVVVFSSVLSPVLVRYFHPTTRLAVFMLVIASFVVCVEVFLAAFFYELHQLLGLFVPLIITNCAILAHCELQSQQTYSFKTAALSGMQTGFGFAFILIIVGALREILGSGTLWSNAGLLFGPWGKPWQWDLTEWFSPIHLFTQPAGGFFAIGFVLIVFEWLKQRLQTKPNLATINYHAR